MFLAHPLLPPGSPLLARYGHGALAQRRQGTWEDGPVVPAGEHARAETSRGRSRQGGDRHVRFEVGLSRASGPAVARAPRRCTYLPPCAVRRGPCAETREGSLTPAASLGRRRTDALTTTTTGLQCTRHAMPPTMPTTTRCSWASRSWRSTWSGGVSDAGTPRRAVHDPVVATATAATATEAAATAAMVTEAAATAAVTRRTGGPHPRRPTTLQGRGPTAGRPPTRCHVATHTTRPTATRRPTTPAARTRRPTASAAGHPRGGPAPPQLRRPAVTRVAAQPRAPCPAASSARRPRQ